eukprot:4484639-Prymnesium_polylepis.1
MPTLIHASTSIGLDISVASAAMPPKMTPTSADALAAPCTQDSSVAALIAFALMLNLTGSIGSTS